MTEFLPSNKTLNKKQMEYIVNYLKNRYPGKSIQEFLDYVGFRFESDPYEQWAKKCKENETLYRGYLKNNLSAEMKECLGYYLNPTEENYRKVGLLNSKDSNIMMDKGDKRDVISDFGGSIIFYYHGIKLTDKSGYQLIVKQGTTGTIS